jgi:cytochrome c biogenesis protein CcmG, thiol:disulfide interchange protein DsbE
LEVLAVNVGQSRETAEAFGAQMNLTFPLLLDPSGAMARKYRISGIPANFLIDRQGILKRKMMGEAFREKKLLQKFLRDQFPEALLK